MIAMVQFGALCISYSALLLVLFVFYDMLVVALPFVLFNN